jgi:hypothetical protein
MQVYYTIVDVVGDFKLTGIEGPDEVSTILRTTLRLLGVGFTSSLQPLLPATNLIGCGV